MPRCRAHESAAAISRADTAETTAIGEARCRPFQLVVRASYCLSPAKWTLPGSKLSSLVRSCSATTLAHGGSARLRRVRISGVSARATPSRNAERREYAVDELGVDEPGVDEPGVDELGVDSSVELSLALRKCCFGSPMHFCHRQRESFNSTDPRQPSMLSGRGSADSPSETRMDGLTAHGS
jgi:hypothetical protein